ncbi:hypothetical protein NVP1081O_090 [Vibrio phage 1.081.O._10N.286.52.C2]|nr:hypothetical protein NVP1081O_090 [Vibrio phage 1.081.O._10N.286.52.C2]
MIGNFDSFLSANRRGTQGGKIYPKFGQVVVELGTKATAFSKDKGAETTIRMMEKANELKSIMQTKLIEDANVNHSEFDINLSENVSVANLLMELEFAAMPAHELYQVKSFIMCHESRLPSIVIKGGELSDIVNEAVKLGYKKKDIHVVFPMDEMIIDLADSDKLIIESLSFDGQSASDVLSMAKDIELGDVYVTMNRVASDAKLSEMTELKIKSGTKELSIGLLNRHIMDNFIVKPAADVSYARVIESHTDRPMLEGFKAYDWRRNMTLLESKQNIFAGYQTKAPMTATSWRNLVDVQESYFTNGWKLKHNNKSIVLTNAENAMRGGQVCEEYRVELSESGYPILDVVAMLESAGTSMTCAEFAKAMMKLDGLVTPERQTITAFVTESASNRVYHPQAMLGLRPVVEAVDDVNSLIKAISNGQFSQFRVNQSFADTMLDQETLNSMMEHIVSDGIDVSVDGDMVEFKVNETKYVIKTDIK